MGMRIGVIGLGSIGERHAKNLIDMGHHILAFDLDRSKSRKFAWREEVGLLIEDSDAIVVASPTEYHAEHIRQANLKGIKTFVEKPIVAKRMEQATTNMKFVLMCGYNLRFHSCVKKAKEWLDDGIIGQPLWANFTLAQYSEKPPYLRDGVILNWSHEIDLCLYLLGEAQVRASSTRLTDGKDDISDILLTHTNGCRSRVHLDYVTKPEIRGFTIVGEKGWMAADLVSRTAWRWDERDSEEIEPTEHFAGTDSWNDNYIEEMQAFLDRIEGKKTLGCTAEEAIKVLEICLEVRKQAGIE